MTGQFEAICGRPPDPAPRLLPGLFAAQVARTPHASALVDGRTRLTYRELDGRADRLVHWLRDRGVGPETVVGLHLPRSAGLVMAMLAVLKTGGTFLPLDPNLPAERIATMTAQAGADLVLTPDDLTTVRSGSVPAPAAAICEDGAAYIAYTSGSTGVPKGAVNTHRGLANRVLAAVHTHGVGPGDRLLAATRVGFDPIIFEVFVPLVAGATLVLAPEGAEGDATALVALLIEHEITAVELVPSVLRTLLDEPRLGEVTRLRWLTSAGEALHADLCRRVLSAVDTEIWNVYGPAECAIGVTDRRYEPGAGAGPVPLGGPIAGTRIVLLDPAGHPVGPGEIGEIHLGGAGLARGYVAAPGLTAERFVPDPDGPSGARLYRTGDLARWTPGGELEFLGRADNQVKVGGVRVEPEEIEAVLAGHPAVRAAAVSAHTDEAGVTRLIASVTAGPDTPSDADLRAFLRGRLPDSHVPSAFHRVETLPLGANGKLDRAALTELAATARTAGSPYLAPRTTTERLVVSLWADVLGVDRVGIDDDFFALGGYSLLLVRLAAKLRAATGATLPVRKLFAAATPAAQARLIDGPPGDLPEITPASPDRDLPLSFAQEQLWLLDRLSPGGAEYIIPITLRLPDGAEGGSVGRVLTALAARHEVLRTRYGLAGGGPVQIVDPTPAIELREIRISPEELPEAISDAMATGFDLERGPVWRALLAHVAGQSPLLLLTIHHIACDGASVVTLRRELDALLAGRPLPEPAVRYGDFACWQRDLAAAGAFDEQLDHWRKRLAGLARLDLPGDRPRPAVRDPRGAAYGFTLPAEVTNAVLDIGRRRGATPFMTLLAGFVVVLARYTGATDIPLGTPVAGRLRSELDGVVGCFLNTLVLRCDVAGDPAFGTLVDRVRTTVVDAQAAQEVPFARLVDELAGERDPSRTPLVQVLFDLHDSGITGLGDTEAELGLLLDAWRGAKADLNLTVEIRRDGSCAAVLEYATALFDAATMRRLAGHYERVLAGVAANPGIRLSEVDILTESERATVVTAWNDVAAPRPELCTPELIAAQAARTPDAVALISGDDRVTYAELQDRAGRLAGRLRELGVGPESVVGVCLDRGIDLVVAFLAIWKAGGAYVPLDPAFPPVRLSHVVADAGARHLITQRAHADLVDGDVIRIVLDDQGQRRAIAGQPVRDLGRVAPGSLAYVMYTSGSTGTPKGVLIDHHGLRNYLMWTVEAYAAAGTGGTPLFSSVAFDMVVPDLYTALLIGQPVHLLPEGFEPTQLGKLLVESGPFTFIKLTPGHLDLLADQLTAEQARGLARLLAVGADAFPAAVLHRWLALAGPDGPALLNEYGPTEISVANSTYAITGPDQPEILPIGSPIPNTTVYVLDERGNPLPAGIPGELYIGGAGVARGYRNRPALTADKFVPDPFGTTPGGRLYRTGDLARRRADGRLEFLGRADEQIKLRGYRIEPAEIVGTLTGHPGVRDAIVVVSGSGATRRLVAYVVPAPGTVPDPADLARHCAAGLPGYLVPAQFVVIGRIPLNPNGKVDRAALPPASASPGVAAPTAPRNPVEERLVTLWAEVLGPDTGTDVHRSFFHVGGNSILAARLVGRIGTELGVTLPLRAVFEHPTVAELAGVVEQEIRHQIAALSDAEIRALSTPEREG